MKHKMLAFLIAIVLVAIVCTACGGGEKVVICGNCATEVSASSQYCSGCGALLFKNDTQPTTATPTSSAHTHSFSAATCTTPSKCECGEIAEKALGHDWGGATCTDTAVCSRCGESSGSALGHDWSDATCTAAKTCSRCNHTEGSALGHTWTNATCTAAKTCSRCNGTEGSALGHSYFERITTEASCANSGVKTFTCARCANSYTESFACKSYSATEIYDNNLNSVGEVITYDKSGNEYSLGTCFVYSADGKVITNYHVIDKAYSANITIGGATYPVQQVLAYDKNIDIAVLKISASGLTPVKLCARSHDVGETVYALGSSRGLTATLSDGIITYSGRVIEGVSYTQHDAPISSGNSGGPLINKYGEVIGINTWSVRESQNLNFAINVSELNKLTYGTPLTMAEFNQKELDAYSYLVEWVKTNGTNEGTAIRYTFEEYTNTEYVLTYSTQYNILAVEYRGISLNELAFSTIHLDSYFYGFSFWGNEVKGYLAAETYTKNTPLTYTSYQGNAADKERVLELTKLSVDVLIEGLRYFLLTNELPISIADLGFTAY